ncbi:MAG: HlyC/CorC family transporter [Actinobacteria bacterium]|nr:HlyC/CorC family transporter [Actinomycetota bacterium]
MTSRDTLLLAAAVVLVLLAGLFAAIDAALTVISPGRVRSLAEAGDRRARSLGRLVTDRPRYTNLLLLLRVACELLATVAVAAVLVNLLGYDWPAFAITAVVMTIVSYVLVGVGPRTIGRQHPYSVTLTTAGPTRALGRLFGPLSSLLIILGNAITPGRGFRAGPFATEVELRELVDLFEARGVVEHGERNMIHSVFDLGDTIVREVMVPRTEIVWIEQDKSVRQTLALALRSGFSRLPVIGENVDDIVGIAYLKDMVRRIQDPNDPQGATPVSEVLRPATFVPESKPADDLLREMQARRTHMAIVIDEYGGTAGLVTIEDVLEEIVGEITDEYDVERPPVEWLDGRTARVTARLTVQDLGELFGTTLPDGEVDTVAGLLAHQLGRVPIPGAAVEVAGLWLTAEGVSGRRNRIDSVLVRRVERVGDEEGTAEDG